MCHAHMHTIMYTYVYRGPVAQNLFLSKSLPLAVDTSSIQTIIVEALGSGVGLHGFVVIGAQGGTDFEGPGGTDFEGPGDRFIMTAPPYV